MESQVFNKSFKYTHPPTGMGIFYLLKTKPFSPQMKFLNFNVSFFLPNTEMIKTSEENQKNYRRNNSPNQIIFNFSLKKNKPATLLR